MGNSDLFFDIGNPRLSTVKKIMRWAKPRSLRIDVDVLDCSKSFARQKSDLVFEDALKLMTPKCVGFFRIILRRDTNAFGLLSDHKDIRSLLEIGVRNIHEGHPANSPEYFVFMYLPAEALHDLRKVFDIRSPD